MADEKRARLLKDVKSMLRSVLISSKEGVPARRISGEYRALTGDHLPYNRLGFSCQEDLFAAIPDVLRVGRNKEGEVTLFAVSDESTAHIQKMVKAQRSKRIRTFRPLKTPIRRPYMYSSHGGPPRRSYPSRSSYPSSRGGPRGRYDPKPFASNQPNYNIAKPSSPTGDLYGRMSRGQPYIRPRVPFTRPRGGASGPSRPSPTYENFAVTSRTTQKYENFAVTISGKKQGGVGQPHSNQSETWDDDDTDSVYPPGVKPKLASVVIRPAVMAHVKPREAPDSLPDQVRFGLNYEVPPRFKRIGTTGSGKENGHPAAPSRDHNAGHRHDRRPATPENDTRPAKAIPDGRLYIRLVEEYCRANKSPAPVFDTMPVKRGFLASVRIEAHTYGSLEPYESKEAAEQAAAMNACSDLHIGGENYIVGREAEHAAAMNACQDLHFSEGKSHGNSQSLTFDPKVKERILEILKGKSNGIWFTRLPFEYKAKYSEDTPNNLEDLLKSWKDDVRLESAPHVNTYIVYPSEEKVVIPPAKLFPLGEQVAVYMSYLSKDGQFYVQHTESNIENMSADIQNLSERASKIPQLDMETGLFCVAKYVEDNSWCRAKVLEWVRGSNQMLILFVDYGNQEQMSLDSLRKLNPKIAADPSQAVRCVLHGVAPHEGDFWSDDAIDVFVHLVQNNELLTTVLEHKEDMCVVELYLPSDDQRSINEHMVRRGVLKSTCDKYEAVMDEKEEELVATEDPSLDTADTDSQLSEGSNEALPGEPDALEFPEDPIWNVYVSFLTSINDITVRLVGENSSDKLEEMETELENIFKTIDFTDEVEITEGMVCIASVESLYHRVRVLEIRKKPVKSRIVQVAKCYYLDHGDTDEVLLEQLRPLTPQLNTLPYQAFHCGLSGLEQWPDKLMGQASEKLFDFALGKTCVAEVVSRTGHHFSVILYDTSGDEDININEAIMQMPTDDYAKLQNPNPGDNSSPSEGAWNDADSVSSENSSTSERSVTMKPKFLKPHMDIQPSIEPHNNSISKTAASFTTSQPGSHSTSTALGKLMTNSGKIPSNVPMAAQGRGTSDNLNIDHLSEKLINAVNLNNPGMGPETGLYAPYNFRLQHDRSASSLDDRSSINPEDMPLPDTCSDFSSNSDVEYLQQTSTANVSSDSVNSYITWNGDQLSESATAESSTVSSPNAMEMSQLSGLGNRASTSVNIWDPKEYLALPLPAPYMTPAVGQFIDVHVRWVSDPENFVCLPYESLPEYTQFMSQIKQYFEDNPPERELTQEDIRVGHLYAGLQCDTWYRIVVKDFLQDSDLVCISLVDIGEFDLMSIADFRPLPVQFWKLPFQAFRAKLNGVTPVQATRWSEASKYKFTELVLNKDLVAVVMGEDKGSGVISLELVDTSEDSKDVHINEIFSSHIFSWLDYVDLTHSNKE